MLSEINRVKRGVQRAHPEGHHRDLLPDRRGKGPPLRRGLFLGRGLPQDLDRLRRAGATRDVLLLKAHLKRGTRLKAAGGINTLETAWELLPRWARTGWGSSRLVKLAGGLRGGNGAGGRMNEVWAHIKTFLLNKGLDIAGAAVVLVVGLWAIKLLTRLVSKSKGFRKADPGAAGFLLSFATVALKLVLFLTVISMLGIPVVNFVTILATAGAAVGLAMGVAVQPRRRRDAPVFSAPSRWAITSTRIPTRVPLTKFRFLHHPAHAGQPQNRHPQRRAFQRDDRQLFGDGRSAAGFGVHGRVCQRHRAGERRCCCAARRPTRERCPTRRRRRG